MRTGRWIEYVRKAAHRPPGYVAARLAREIGRQARRPWVRVRPRLLTEERLLARTRASSVDALWESLRQQPFLLRPSDRAEYVEAFRRRWPDQERRLIAAADAALRHQFDLLGSGPRALGDRLPWHADFKTGREWPLHYAADIDYIELDRPSDVKVPWELSRCQHFVRLGQAYWLTGDERYAREFVDETLDWIDRNPWGLGVNWAIAMEAALRAVSWMWAFYFFADANACKPPAFRRRFLQSLWLHGEFIASNLEHADVNGNHYLADGVGLVFTGLFFRRAPTARTWLETGRAIVLAEIFKQVHEDGVDFEQSTAYHRLVLEAFQTAYLLLERAGEPVSGEHWLRLRRMHEFVAAYTKPGGSAPLIGDADDGRVQVLGTEAMNDHRYLLSTAAVLFEDGAFKTAAARLWDDTLWLLGPQAVATFDRISDGPEPASRAFPQGGWYVMRAEPATHVIVDAAEVGMQGRGGHGHNDVLSFELTLAGIDVITDCGAYVYTADRAARHAFRSTASHNTLQVDGAELNRMSHPDDLWRLQYDAAPVGIVWTTSPAADYLRVGHRGYERLDPPVAHIREFLLRKRDTIVVLHDQLLGAGSRELAWRFHFDPLAAPVVLGDVVRIDAGGRTTWLYLVGMPGSLQPEIRDGWVSPTYGVKRPAQVLTLEAKTTLPAELLAVFAPRALSAAELNECASELSGFSHEATECR